MRFQQPVVLFTFLKKGGSGLKFSSQQWLWMWILVVTAALFLAPASPLAADGGPAPALKPLSADGQMTLSEPDRCPVCAMFPARRPQTAAAMTLKSGETFYFCGNGCLLRTWLRPAVYLGRSQAEIDRLVVRDYFSGQPIDGRTATWVAGSDVVGPMGPAIIALGDSGQLAVFKSRHGGETVFTFDQVDDDLWKLISRRELPAAKTD
jgi:nitrous oxide reductase accessory protein NosL